MHACTIRAHDPFHQYWQMLCDYQSMLSGVDWITMQLRLHSLVLLMDQQVLHACERRWLLAGRASSCRVNPQAEQAADADVADVHIRLHLRLQELAMARLLLQMGEAVTGSLGPTAASDSAGKHPTPRRLA